MIKASKKRVEKTPGRGRDKENIVNKRYPVRPNEGQGGRSRGDLSLGFRMKPRPGRSEKNRGRQSTPDERKHKERRSDDSRTMDRKPLRGATMTPTDGSMKARVEKHKGKGGESGPKRGKGESRGRSRMKGFQERKGGSYDSRREKGYYGISEANRMIRGQYHQ